MSNSPSFPLPVPHPVPALAAGDTGAGIPLPCASHATFEKFERVLTLLVADESALYAITRDWRYDTAARKFVQLNALLDEQFAEIGVRLLKLAARHRALGLRISTGRRDCPKTSPTAVDDQVMEAHVTRGLLDLHSSLLVRLRAAKEMTAGHVHDPATTELLADLIAEHEKDAFMLRALLWEIQNRAA